LERCVTLHRDRSPEIDKVVTATLKAIMEYGFYLTHAGSPLFSLADQKPLVISHLNGPARPARSTLQ
jgi:hypothetical protein